MNEIQELEALRKLLHEIADLSDHASLTGSLSGGNRRAAQRYNAVLDRLITLDAVPPGLFVPISEDSGFGEIGVEARMLASFLKKNGSHEGSGKHDKGILLRLAPFVDSKDLSVLIREQLRSGAPIDLHDLTNLAPFLERSILGDMLRDHLTAPKQHDTDNAAVDSERVSVRDASAPVTPVPPSPANVSVVSRDLAPANSRAEQLDDLVELLKNPHLSSEERDGLLERIKHVATT